jgi:hypothetical protein
MPMRVLHHGTIRLADLENRLAIKSAYQWKIRRVGDRAHWPKSVKLRANSMSCHDGTADPAKREGNGAFGPKPSIYG